MDICDVFFTWILDIPCWILDIQKKPLFIQRFCNTLYLLLFLIIEEFTKLFFGFSSRRCTAPGLNGKTRIQSWQHLFPIPGFCGTTYFQFRDLMLALLQ